MFKKHFALKKLLALLVLLIFSTGCAQQTAFFSTPIGATVSINGEPIGVTPCDFRYMNSTGKTYDVTIEKDGYEPITREFKAEEVDQKARKTWLAAGVVWTPLWLGTLFTKKLHDSYEFVLKRKSLFFAKKPHPTRERLF